MKRLYVTFLTKNLVKSFFTNMIFQPCKTFPCYSSFSIKKCTKNTIFYYFHDGYPKHNQGLPVMFADGSTLTAHKNPVFASSVRQNYLDDIQSLHLSKYDNKYFT